MPPTTHIFEHTPDSLSQWCERNNMPPFRAKQVLEWVYLKGVLDPAGMSNLSKLDRDKLAADIRFSTGDVVKQQLATDGTQKLLVQWHDRTTNNPSASEGLPQQPPTTSLPILGNTLDQTRQTECVMIPAEDRRTACISSQVGCPVGCKFCASGIGGLDENLTAGRIVEQVWMLREFMRAQQAGRGTRNDADFPRITNVVFMGMGEPLSNLANVVPAIRTICALWGHAISARKVTISTVGLPKAIEKLAEQLELPVTLALSLHAPNDAIRRQLIPWAEYTTINELLAACQKWFEKTGREITLEYTLLRGVNDQPQHARELADIARDIRANINLIRYNEVKGMPFERPRDEDVRGFQEFLLAKNLNVHIRASRGRDIAAACGQLR
ncbi:MAG TPA: 23S rRNA (adenine(2503)-C(2))-methyltransferase RlmN, partial [Phycisphaerales bacterium]|nr:23S rRNA (adenine(2503)-C(2))-methyltransferase RlmN [Phycisphaerales bacterium]